MKLLRAAMQILWAPGAAAREAAGAGLWLPLLLLAAAGALAEWPRFIRLGGTQFAQARMDATPEGMFPGAILMYVALAYLAPVLLPTCLLIAGWLMDRYVLWVLDTKAKRVEVMRVVAYGALPMGLERLLVGALILACGERCNPLNPLASNLAFFLNPKETEVFWYEAARGVDVFSAWAVILMSRALAAVTDLPASHFYPALAVVWAAGSLLRAGLLG